MGRLRSRRGGLGSPGSSAERLSAKHAEHVREIAKGLRREANTTTNRHLPDRGEDDAYGGVFEGLRAAKLARQVLSDPELHFEQVTPDYMGGRGLGARIKSLHNDVKLTRANLIGPVVQPDNIEGPIPAGKLAADVARKNEVPNQGNQLGWGNGSAFIPDSALAKSYAQKSDIPDISGKASKSDLNKLAQRVKKLEKKK